ncbi:SSU ribosomal protein S30P /sigma 54 modulation protein [Hasllibacter halocynthiae]|uniref:Ribosome hibernation promoting factor n=1 Tax=Hasllibacter halocynthiae TaxID=595589 RepID=A0A2T0X227_9RHOB|nr:ribosome-associated translation inhibitor RaiA [Hasllibacter halocynthiae]PRY93006.1 SSU ribosomal protein S30P /sigma 54 modulation protein [Hasllibacter halocynthiae]
MRTRVSGRQIDVGEALRGHVTSQIEGILSKYSQRPTDAEIVFSRRGHEHSCDAEIHLSTGMTVQASARAPDIYAAFDACGEKMDKQLRRYKRRLKNHHAGRARPIEVLEGAHYVLAPSEEEESSEDLAPLIVAEMQTQIPSLSVGEAVMQMELKGATVLVFRKEGNGGINVVYAREDGNVGWIDPGGSA